MQKQRYCYCHFLITMRLTLSVSKGISLQIKGRKTLENLSSLIFPLLRYLIGSLPIRVRLARKTKTTKEISGTTEDKNRVAAIIFLPQVSTLFLKRKERRLSKSSAITAIKKYITPTSVLRI